MATQMGPFLSLQRIQMARDCFLACGVSAVAPHGISIVAMLQLCSSEKETDNHTQEFGLGILKYTLLFKHTAAVEVYKSKALPPFIKRRC